MLSGPQRGLSGHVAGRAARAPSARRRRARISVPTVILATLLVGYWPAAHPNNLENAAGKWYAAASDVTKVAEWLNWNIGQLGRLQPDAGRCRDPAVLAQGLPSR